MIFLTLQIKNILLTLLFSGSNDKKPEQSAAPQPPASSAPSATDAVSSSDPRAALFANLSGGSAPAAPAPAPAPAAPAAEPQQAAAPSTGGFDPNAFARQLQQLQQMQQGMAAGSQGGAPGMPMPPAMPEMKPGGHSEEGYHAGNIFIPAKDEGKMFIGGLNWETTDESMKNYFSTFGEVLDVNVMRDANTGRSRGFGFLTFKDAKSVSEVLKREHFLDGKIIDPKRAIPREEQDKTAKIFVGGVGMDVTESDFKEFFERYGTVIDAQLMIDKDTGRPRGFGFVTFDDHAAVDKIVAEKFLDLKGKSIEVKRAEPRLSREWQSRNQMRPAMGGMGGMQGNQFYANAMDPNMMTQYYQQWQTYMTQMQEMMKNGGAQPGMPAGMPAGMAAGMPGAPGAAPSAATPESSESSSRSSRDNDYYDDRDPRRERRRADERRRSRSPPGGRRRRGGSYGYDRRDRNYRR